MVAPRLVASTRLRDFPTPSTVSKFGSLVRLALTVLFSVDTRHHKTYSFYHGKHKMSRPAGKWKTLHERFINCCENRCPGARGAMRVLSGRRQRCTRQFVRPAILKTMRTRSGLIR